EGLQVGRGRGGGGDGNWAVAGVKPRHFKGPRAFDLSGIPLHEDNQTIVKERIFLDKADKDLLHNEMTVIDHALTHPWTVKKSYRRAADAQAEGPEYLCVERTETMRIGGETYRFDKGGYPSAAQKGPETPRFPS